MKKLSTERFSCLLLVSLLAFTLSSTIGCGGSTDNDSKPASSASTYSGSYPIEVVATIGMVGDLVRQVGGNKVDVQQICGPGVDPHLYKPNRDDVVGIMSADMVFYSGLMLEGKMTDTLVKVARKKPVVAITESIDETVLLQPDEFEGHYDPHVWNDVSAWSQSIKSIENALIDFDPDNADIYAENANALRDELAKLHQYGVDSIATVPNSSRVLITSHDAFNYFGRAYGLEVQGVQGLSTESEAGVQRINKLVDMLVEKKVQSVFVESSVSQKNVDALIEGAKSRGHDVRIGGELFSDAMGKDGTYEGTYLGMLDHNITIVTRALGGKADAKGYGGKLAEEE